MLLQTLLALVSMIALTGTILVASLAAAKASLHRLVATKAQAALTDATADFLGWARTAVRANGSEYAWNVTRPDAPIFERLCAADASTCPFGATIAWKVTGASARGTARSANTSQANNLAQSVDEQRLSATISVTISDATGRVVYGGATREVTARVFDAVPYVAITATKDASSLAGGTARSEGDTGGAAPLAESQESLAVPDPRRPSGFVDTRIHATIDCANAPAFSQSAPASPQDGGQAYLDASVRPFGSLAWAYETPCTPQYPVSEPPAGTTNYTPPNGSTYAIEPSDASATWTKGDQPASAFPP